MYVVCRLGRERGYGGPDEKFEPGDSDPPFIGTEHTPRLRLSTGVIRSDLAFFFPSYLRYTQIHSAFGSGIPLNIVLRRPSLALFTWFGSCTGYTCTFTSSVSHGTLTP